MISLKMLRNFILKFFNNTNYQLAIIDNLFPQAKPMGFRNTEINALLDIFQDSKAYCMYVMKAGNKAWSWLCCGKSKKQFKKDLNGYLSYYPYNINKIKYLPPFLHKKLVYCYFLGETYTLLPYLNNNKLPFVFVLYPGGCFALNNKYSNDMLREVFRSPYFQKVIVTQPITKKYLLENNLCEKDKIYELMGGYLQFNKSETKNLKYLFYPNDKTTIDICFCAFKYIEKGIDKGYDLFINAAKKLVPKYTQLHFHIIGSFDENEIDITEIKDNLSFYGILQSEHLKEIYPQMDICLSPNRVFKLGDGCFDGFPGGGESMAFNCTLLTTDELNNNYGFIDNEDLIIIKPNIDDICNKIEWLVNNMDKCYEIGKSGRNKIYNIMDPQERVVKISNLIKDCLTKLNNSKKGE